ncbi:hypothetical protein ACFL49_02830 [Candidatus Omnitrophota bacterium]
MSLKRLKKKKGQAVSSEYVMVFFLVVASMTTMTVYIRRALQARVFDARNKMVEIVAAESEAIVRWEYEPYYSQTDATARRVDSTTKDLNYGIFTKTVDNWTNVTSEAQVLDPSFAN